MSRYFAIGKYRVFEKEDIDYFVVNSNDNTIHLRYRERHDKLIFARLKSDTEHLHYIGFHGSDGQCLDAIDDIRDGKYDVDSKHCLFR